MTVVETIRAEIMRRHKEEDVTPYMRISADAAENFLEEISNMQTIPLDASKLEMPEEVKEMNPLCNFDGVWLVVI